MAGRPCSICSDSTKARRVAEMIGAGATDQAIAVALGVGRASVQRHRQNHVLAPTKALVEAAGKGQDAREQRQQLITAAEAGDPLAFVGLAAIVSDLRRATDRLERTADAAETDNQRLAVASLAGQQLRAAEVRAKLGAVGGYAPQKAREAGEGVHFSIVYQFGDHTETITAVVDGGSREPAESIPRRTPQISDWSLPVAGRAAAEEFDEDV